MSAAVKPRCKYWATCYRKNPDHKREFWHPSDQAEMDRLDAEAAAAAAKAAADAAAAGGGGGGSRKRGAADSKDGSAGSGGSSDEDQGTPKGPFNDKVLEAGPPLPRALPTKLTGADKKSSEGGAPSKKKVKKPAGAAAVAAAVGLFSSGGSSDIKAASSLTDDEIKAGIQYDVELAERSTSVAAPNLPPLPSEDEIKKKMVEWTPRVKHEKLGEDEDDEDEDMKPKKGKAKKIPKKKKGKKGDGDDEDGKDDDDGDTNKDGTFEHCQVWYADQLIPNVLTTSMDKQFELLASHPTAKDYHPGSHEQVLNLVHPSLYPFVVNVSPVRVASTKTEQKELKQLTAGLSVKSKVAGQQLVADLRGYELKLSDAKLAEEWKTYVRHTQKRIKAAKADQELEEGEDSAWEEPDFGGGADGETPHIDGVSALRDNPLYGGRAYEDSPFQWLPAEYEVANDGTVEITSPINNLDQSDFPLLYRDLAHIFAHAIPLLEATLDTKLRGTTLQVITKAANYVLKPGGTDTYSGSWHVEGMPSEKIAASVIYYYHTSDHLKGDGLSFRRLKTEDEMADLLENGHEHDIYDASPEMELGTVPTEVGRLLCFPNHLQHKVAPITNSSASHVGVRKILCFFVVDPEERIVSTAHIEDQQWDRVKDRFLYYLNLYTGDGEFPKELSSLICEYLQTGFTHAEAAAIRSKLMIERKFRADYQERLWERTYSFCEH